MNYSEDNTITCTSGKPCFRTKAEIKSYISRRNHRKGGDGFKYYKCGICGCWHLTTHTPTPEHTLRKKADKYNRLEKKRNDARYLEIYGIQEGQQTYESIRYHAFSTEYKKAM